MIRLRENGASQSQLLTVYIARVRSILEDCAPVYCGLLNASQRNKLEGLQILAVAVIMGVHATSYAQGLLSLGITTLEERRLTLTKSFASKTYKSPRFSNWFTAHPPPPRGSRQVMPRFYIPRFKTSRALGAPLIFYAELLNDVTDEELSSGIDTTVLHLPTQSHFAAQASLQQHCGLVTPRPTRRTTNPVVLVVIDYNPKKHVNEQIPWQEFLPRGT